MKPIKKYVLTILLVIVVLLLLAWWLWPSAYIQKQPTAFKPLPADTVTLPTLIQYQRVSGTVMGSVQSTLMAQVIANVTAVYIHPGEAVKKGQLLIQLDDRDYRAKVNQAQQQLNAQQAILTNATLTYHRMEQLVKSGAVSKSDFDTAQANYLQAQANVAGSQDALESAQVQLSYCQVRAPTDGIVLDKLVDVGDQTLPLFRSLLTFKSDAQTQVKANIPESMSNKIQVGEAMFAQVGTQRFNAMVSEIAPTVDPNTRSFSIKLNVPNAKNNYSGTYATVLVPVGETSVIAIPSMDIEHNGQLEMVYVQTQQGLSRVMITTGRTLDHGFIEVLSGLNVGDELVKPEVARGQ
jgi:RND family efflux transporter MFP subunit